MIKFEDAVKIVRDNINKGWAVLYGCGDENCYIFLTSPSADDSYWVNVGYTLFFVKDSERYGTIPTGSDTNFVFSDIPKDTVKKINNFFGKVLNPNDPDITFVDTTYDRFIGPRK